MFYVLRNTSLLYFSRHTLVGAIADLTIKLQSVPVELSRGAWQKGRSDSPMSTGVTNNEEPLESVKKVPAATPFLPSRKSRVDRQAKHKPGY